MLIRDLLNVLTQYNASKGVVKKFFKSYSSEMDALRVFVEDELVGLPDDMLVSLELAMKVQKLLNSQLPQKLLSSSDSIVEQPLSIRILFELRQKCDETIRQLTLEQQKSAHLQAARPRASTTQAVARSAPIDIATTSRERGYRCDVVMHSCPVASVAPNWNKVTFDMDLVDAEKPIVFPK